MTNPVDEVARAIDPPAWSEPLCMDRWTVERRSQSLVQARAARSAVVKEMRDQRDAAYALLREFRNHVHSRTIRARIDATLAAGAAQRNGEAGA